MQNELNELRNQVRTLRRMIFGVFGLVVVGGLLAATSLQSVPDVVRAKQFEVVNDEGKTQAILFAGPEGGEMVILNKDGKQVAAIFADANGDVL
jgi:hypothetical protein